MATYSSCSPPGCWDFVDSRSLEQIFKDLRKFDYYTIILTLIWHLFYKSIEIWWEFSLEICFYTFYDNKKILSGPVSWRIFCFLPQNQFWFIFIINLCRHFFCDIRKKGSRPKWTIYKHVSDNSKKCLSVDNSGILTVVVIVVCSLCPRSSLHQLM